MYIIFLEKLQLMANASREESSVLFSFFLFVYTFQCGVVGVNSVILVCLYCTCFLYSHE